MQTKIIIFLSFFLNLLPLVADVVTSLKPHTPGLGYHQTWYLGSNEQALFYQQYGEGAQVDDGLFVAIQNGGPYGGYSYFELNHPIAGAVDGGPAHLPHNPEDLDGSSHRVISEGYEFGAPSGMFAVWRGTIPELPDLTFIPIGSKFFFWISGGGHFQLGTSVLEKPSKLITVRTQAVTKPEYAIWFEPSAINEKTFTVTRECNVCE